ncbi:MAG: PIN domain-containing protein [Spirochaetales bacterium]|nr:PIN domain-containing protein [Spirochaetales bacterium]
MKQILVDSNVILDIFENDPVWFDWSAGVLDGYSRDHLLCINPVIYTEISIGFDRIEDLEKTVFECGFRLIEIPKEALFLAGKAFMQYRRGKGVKTTTLPDFFIGAHAAVMSLELITRDAKRIGYYFPSVRIICP